MIQARREGGAGLCSIPGVVLPCRVFVPGFSAVVLFQAQPQSPPSSAGRPTLSTGAGRGPWVFKQSQLLRFQIFFFSRI